MNFRLLYYEATKLVLQRITVKSSKASLPSLSAESSIIYWVSSLFFNEA